MVKKRASSKKPSKAPANLIAGLAIVGLVILSIVDLFQPAEVPNFIYFGLIGSALGAKFDDIFGGRRS